MSGISAIYILDKKGKILITRAYRHDAPQYIYEKYATPSAAQRLNSA
jgi:hypothetical protein